MEFKTQEIKDKNIWENLLLGCEEKTFLQSWNWGEFQIKTGNKIWRLGIYLSSESLSKGDDNEELIGVALVIKIQAKRGTFLFCPHGPIIKEQRTKNKEQILRELINILKEIAKEEGASFVRISPIWERNKENIRVFKDLDFKEAPIHMHPEITWMLDITPPEDTLLMQMRKTTRYLIRQAQKNPDVKIEKSPAFASSSPKATVDKKASTGKQELSDVEKFNALYQTTVDRHHFTPFSLDYLKNEFSVFSPDNQPVRQAQGCLECTEGQAVIFSGKYKEELIASAIIIFWQQTAFYHQGASSLKCPKIPVSYLLQWEVIKQAKERDCKIYNFWGIAPTDSKEHPWLGLTLFKKGFGGYKKEYVKTQDLPLSMKYWLNYSIERIRRSKRGL